MIIGKYMFVCLDFFVLFVLSVYLKAKHIFLSAKNSQFEVSDQSQDNQVDMITVVFSVSLMY